MISSVEKSDTEIKSDVLAELKYEPSVKVTDIGVLVSNGTVTLNGNATSYGEKWQAVVAAKRVVGVRAIADDIKVKLWDSFVRTDGDIAAAAANQIKWSTSIPADTVKITLREGWLTLEGEVGWWYEKKAAEEAVADLTGILGVTNRITIKPKPSAANIQLDIESAFERSAIVDGSKIKVEISGNKVTLRGKVRNYSEREEAERVAWAAAGVTSVDNSLDVEGFGGFDD